MLNKLLNNHLTVMIIFMKRSLTVQPKFNLAVEMKLLNDQNRFKEALKLFDKHQQKNDRISSGLIIVQVLKACTRINDFQRGLTIYNTTSSEVKNNLYVKTSLIDLYMKCGSVEQAESLFEATNKKPLPMHATMIKGYIQNNMPNKAIDLLKQIKNPDPIIFAVFFNACAQIKQNKLLDLLTTISSQIPKSFYSNTVVTGSLLNALIKCGGYSAAETIFSKSKRCVIGYGNLMSGFNKEENYKKTLDLFNQMKIDGIVPDHVIYLCLIKAISKISVFPISQSIIQQIPKSYLSNQKIETALIDMWGKTGYVDEAKKIFEKISRPDQIGFTAMVNAYGLNGMGSQAIELFRRMPSEFISEPVYVCVINACSHSGLVDEGRLIFSNVQNKTEKIYNTMIDCFSRASMFEEAQNLIDEFEQHHSPTYSMYMALLSGARNEKNIQLSQKVFDRMKKLFPDSTNPLISAAILLANTYTSSGEVEKASDIRIQLQKSGLKKKVGLTWTSIDGEISQFRAHDQSHPQSAEIYAEADKISEELLAHGHQYDSSWITRPLNDDETISSVLCGHSEQLAIAWNFVKNPKPTRIHLTKNLRVCGNCHQATKLIAAIRQCEIIVRDANRIHHFYTNGQCSCNDYF